jgi:hypothetical protein
LVRQTAKLQLSLNSSCFPDDLIRQDLATIDVLWRKHCFQNIQAGKTCQEGRAMIHMKINPINHRFGTNLVHFVELIWLDMALCASFCALFGIVSVGMGSIAREELTLLEAVTVGVLSGLGGGVIGSTIAVVRSRSKR